MLIKGLILTILIITGGLLTLACLILAGVKRRDKKARNTWLTMFSISLVLTASTAIYTLVKVVDKTADKSIEIKNAVVEGAKEGLAETMSDTRKFLLDTTKNDHQINLLKSYVPDSLKGKEPSAFYTYFGFRDWYRFPLVYPYSIYCVEDVEDGQLHNERNAVDIKASDDGVEWIQVYGITHFSFDQNLMLAKLRSPMDSTDRRFVIFHFTTQQVELFSTSTELRQQATELGFTGPDTMMTIEEYDRLF